MLLILCLIGWEAVNNLQSCRIVRIGGANKVKELTVGTSFPEKRENSVHMAMVSYSLAVKVYSWSPMRKIPKITRIIIGEQYPPIMWDKLNPWWKKIIRRDDSILIDRSATVIYYIQYSQRYNPFLFPFLIITNDYDHIVL